MCNKFTQDYYSFLVKQDFIRFVYYHTEHLSQDQPYCKGKVGPMYPLASFPMHLATVFVHFPPACLCCPKSPLVSQTDFEDISRHASSLLRIRFRTLCCLDGSFLHQPIFCCSSHSPYTSPLPIIVPTLYNSWTFQLL